MRRKPLAEIIALDNKITSFFLTYISNYHKKIGFNNNKKWTEYFKFLILELYDYRNSDLHTGIINEFSEIKLEAIIPRLLNRSRWHLIDLCKKNPGLTFKELIER